jgi:hypothetical protein
MGNHRGSAALPAVQAAARSTPEIALMTQLSAVELRTLAAAHIAAAMVADQPRDTIEDVISDVAEIAVKLAKAIEQAAGRSIQTL